MPNQPTDLQNNETKEVQPAQATDVKELIRTGGSAVTLTLGIAALLAWIFSLSPLLFIPLTGVLTTLVFIGLYVYKIKPKFEKLATENETLKEVNTNTIEPSLLESSVSKIENKNTQKFPQASIQTRLIIDSVNTRKVESHIQLENVGNVLVKNIRVGFYTKHFQNIEAKLPLGRVLPPNGKISKELLPSVLKPKTGESLLVKVLYSVEFDGIEKEFLQTVRFLLSPKDIKPQTIEPESWDETEGNEHVIEQGVQALFVNFAQPEGVVGFSLSDIRPDGSPNMIHFTNESRSFTFDATFKVASLKLKTDSGELINLDLPLLPVNNKKRMHVIFLMWDKKGGAFKLDDVEKTHPPNTFYKF